MNKLMFLGIFFTFTDLRVPQPLPKGIPLAKVNTQVIEGHYFVKGPKYTSTAYIAQPLGEQRYVVYQYTGSTVTKGVGFMDGDRFVIGWKQDESIGVSSIHFRNGKGRASWVSNPGPGNVGHETWSLIDAEN